MILKNTLLFFAFLFIASNSHSAEAAEFRDDDEPDLDSLRYLDAIRFVNFANTVVPAPLTTIPEEVFIREDEFRRYHWERLVVLYTSGDSDYILPHQIYELKHLLQTNPYFTQAPKQLRFAIAWRRFSVQRGPNLEKAMRAWGRLCWLAPAIMLSVRPWNHPAEQSGMDFFDLTSAAFNLGMGAGKIFFKNYLIASPRLFEGNSRQYAPMENPFDAIRASLNVADYKDWDLIVRLKEAVSRLKTWEVIAAENDWSHALKRKPAMHETEHEEILASYYDVLIDLITLKITISELKFDDYDVPQDFQFPPSMAGLGRWPDVMQGSHDSKADDEAPASAVLFGEGDLEAIFPVFNNGNEESAVESMENCAGAIKSRRLTPFPCSECSKVFTSHSKLEIHKRVHTGEKPFVCPTCAADFSQKGSLNTHIKTYHGGSAKKRKKPAKKKS